jgi:superfamily II DNA or RNA helicase
MIVGTDRKSIVKAYKSGEIFGLINYNIFSAGFDDPNTGTVILACPTKSKRKFLQQLFRVTRLKTEEFVKLFGQVGTILDVIDGTSKHSLVNTRELDKGLPIEDRLFLSKKNRDLLLETRQAREREFTATVITEDKKVNLFKLPKITFSESFKLSEIATTAQLLQIKRLGYDTENGVYTKKMITDIFGKQAADEKMIKKLKEHNYDINGFVSVAEAMAASEEIKNRKS